MSEKYIQKVVVLRFRMCLFLAIPIGLHIRKWYWLL